MLKNNVYRKFREIEISRSELDKRKADEKKKIKVLRDSAIQQVLHTMGMLETTVDEEFTKLDTDYLWKAAQLTNANYEIEKMRTQSTEIGDLMKMAGENEAASKFQNVLVAVESQQTGLPLFIPTVHPSRTFSSKAKHADVGFVQLAEFKPEDFNLVLKIVLNYPVVK